MKEERYRDTTIEMLTKQITDEVAISAKAIVERDRLRKALEEAYTAMMDAISVMEMEKRDFSLMPQCTIKDASSELERILYPVVEGDKE